MKEVNIPKKVKVTRKIDGKEIHLKNNYDLIRAVERYPTYADSIILPLFVNRNEFTELINTHRELYNAMDYFPEHALQLLQHVLNDPILCELVIPDYLAIGFLGAYLPKQREKLTKHLFENKTEFIRCIPNGNAFIQVIKFFPGYMDHFMSYMLNDKDITRVMINNCDILSKMVEEYPSYENSLLQYILKNEDEFKRIINNWFAYHQALELFPKEIDSIDKLFKKTYPKSPLLFPAPPKKDKNQNEAERSLINRIARYFKLA